MKMGEIIKRIKFEGDLNQSQIADILGCKQASISRIKRDLQFPNTELLFKIIKLAKQYNIQVEVEDLL